MPMTDQAIRIALQLTTLPGPLALEAGLLGIKYLAAGAGFADTFIRAVRYPGVNRPKPLTMEQEIVGIADAIAPVVARIGGAAVWLTCSVSNCPTWSKDGSRCPTPCLSDTNFRCALGNGCSSERLSHFEIQQLTILTKHF